MEPITAATTIAAAELTAPSVAASAGFALCWRSAALGAGAVVGVYGLYRAGKWAYGKLQQHRAEKALAAAAQAAAQAQAAAAAAAATN